MSPRSPLVLAVSCVLLASPAGAGERTILSTEYHDERAGAESARAVEAQIGVLDDPALDAYVDRIGSVLLRSVPRRRFRYHFAVVDMEAPNAFALPGGYVFVSRGLLALANDEDELACVIGHEITHVERRHAAAQQAIAQRTIPINPWFAAGKQAAYGREMEREADEGGQILCAAAGYDPMGMSTFLARLGSVDRLEAGYARGTSFFDTHPGSDERAAANAVRAREIRRAHDPGLGDTRVALFEKIDGLPVGQRPETGIFQGDTFLHPVMDFVVRFPSDWEKQNANAVVGARAPRGDAVVYVTAQAAQQPAGSARASAEAWVRQQPEGARMVVRESKPVKVGHIDAWRMRVDASGGPQSLRALVTFIPYRAATFQIVGMAPSLAAGAYEGRMLSTARSFRPLSPEERGSIESLRLRVTEARPGESPGPLALRVGSAWSVLELALQNGVDVTHRFDGGELVKYATAEPWTPPAGP